MLTEYNIMKVLQYEKQYKITLLGKYICIRPIKILTTLLITIAFFMHIQILCQDNAATIWNVVKYLFSLITCTVFTAYVARELLGNIGLKESYKQLMDVNEQLNTILIHENDLRLLLMAGAHYLIFIAIMLYPAVVRGYYLSLGVFAPISQEILSLAISKYLIAKRLKHIRTSDEYMARIEDTVFHTHQLLHCNANLNKSYGFLVTSYVILVFQVAIYSLYTYWCLFGAKTDIPDESMTHVVLGTVWDMTLCFTALLLAASSSGVNNEVEEIKLELDVTLSARNCTEDQWRLVYMFLMELHHTPVQLSALGFFGISWSSVSNALATLTSIMLVLIQYT